MLIGGGLALTMAMATTPAAAQQAAPPTSNRVALVIGEGAYRSGALPAAPNDAGLVAETLAGAGFDVTGARDLDGDGLRGAVRDFLTKAGAIGPDGIALVYFAGRALQFDGDNYFEPVDARLSRPSDVPIETLRLGDLDRALAALPIQAKVVVVDGAYAGQPADLGLPPGLALVEAEQGELLAFNTAPGTEAPKAAGPYGIYAQSFVQAMKQGGAPVEDVFDRLRLAVETATGGAVVPWDSDKLTRSFKFFDRAADAPLVESAQIPFSALQKRPLRDFPPDQAYDVVIARDTLPAYAEFLTAFPDSPLVRRIRLLQAIRREALFWNAAIRGGTPPAFWTYLARYPKGPHAAEARRRLSRLAVALDPAGKLRAASSSTCSRRPKRRSFSSTAPSSSTARTFHRRPAHPCSCSRHRSSSYCRRRHDRRDPGSCRSRCLSRSRRSGASAKPASSPRPGPLRAPIPTLGPSFADPTARGSRSRTGLRQAFVRATLPISPQPQPHPLRTRFQRRASVRLRASYRPRVSARLRAISRPRGAGQLPPAGQPGLVGRPVTAPALTTLPGANPLPTPGAPGRTSAPALPSGEPAPKARVNSRGTPKPAASRRTFSGPGA